MLQLFTARAGLQACVCGATSIVPDMGRACCWEAPSRIKDKGRITASNGAANHIQLSGPHPILAAKSRLHSNHTVACNGCAWFNVRLQRYTKQFAVTAGLFSSGPASSNCLQSNTANFFLKPHCTAVPTRAWRLHP